MLCEPKRTNIKIIHKREDGYYTVSVIENYSDIRVERFYGRCHASDVATISQLSEAAQNLRGRLTEKTNISPKVLA